MQRACPRQRLWRISVRAPKLGAFISSCASFLPKLKRCLENKFARTKYAQAFATACAAFIVLSYRRVLELVERRR
jgi:hypothetical protein